MPNKDRLHSGEGSTPTATAKENYTASSIGNDKGSIVFGHIHEDAAVTSGVMVRSPSGDHQMSLDIDGHRKGWTQCIGPGNFTIKHGSGTPRDENGKLVSSIMINAEKGDIHIIATDGKIRMEADDIELIARGEGGKAGNITMTASENVVIKDTKKILFDCTSMFKITTSGDGMIAANSMLAIYGSVIKGVTDAVSVKGAKNSNRKFWAKMTQV